MSERIVKEFKDFNFNIIYGISLGLIDDSYYDWRISLRGQRDSYYRDGLFFLKAHLPTDYPNSAPEFIFETPIYHMNVNPKAPKEEGDESLGHVRISILNCWKPQYTMKEVMLNIISLLYMVNPDRAYGEEILKEYYEEPEIYFEKAKYFSKKYANPKIQKKEYDTNKDWDFSL